MLLPNRKFRTYNEETTGWSLGIQKQPWHRGSLCTDHCKSINQSTNQSCLGRILTLYQEELTLTQLCFLFQTKLSLDYTQDKNYQVLQPLMVSINSSEVGRTEHLSKWC